ncbi:MAG: bifunctional 3-(3-hydroxy-phenyl)propionate/3-hydroxycinnamic acid hydroxylase [Burkholderiales bacterium]|nr:bifunctional 3-(3-hydroxy-phenyl)propionate/3-hydroxycinnamic acid hydroxylase [Burkholderiales bacterium]
MRMAESFDVAIVGYGPAGATAAALLGQAGLSVYVCDRLHGVYEIPRAIALDHEIMRVFQEIGVVDAISPYFEPFTPSEYFGVDGQLIRRMTMVAPPYPQGYTPSLVFTQPPVEMAIRQRVSEFQNVKVATGVELKSLEQSGESVTLNLLSDDGTSSTICAHWVIACDGGSSTVRGRVGIALEDLGFDEPWLVVDVRVNEKGLAKLPKTSVQYCEPERPCTYVIGPGNHRRWEISLKQGESSQLAATPEGTWKLLSRWLTPDDGELWRQASYRFHALVAEQWKTGRVFLAGDAAHMQPPFLGQGMCQGVRDIANLCWKLAAVVKANVTGHAAQNLLESYGAERKAHVRELTSRIKAIGAVICERDVEKARERDAKLLKECGGVVKDTPRQDVLPRLECGLLSKAESSGRGALFPQPKLNDGKLMDMRFGYGWRLVTDGTILPYSVPKGITCISLAEKESGEAEGVVEGWMRKQECHAALIRPDHYVFGTAATHDQVDQLVAELHKLLNS